jgi:HK97 family phage portal protein
MFGLFKKSVQSFSSVLKNGTGKEKQLDSDMMYAKIAIAFACVEKIASQAEAFSFEVEQNEKKIDNHPALKLLFGKQFNSGGQTPFSQLIRDLLISGEAFALRLPYGETSKNILKIKPMFAKDISKNTRNNNVIDSYFVNYSGQSIKIPIDLITGYSDLLRISLYHSSSYIDGTSPMEAVGIEGALIDKALNWNLSTLVKGVKPSAVFTSDTALNLTKQQQSDLIENIRQLYSGSENANNAIVLPSGLKYTPMQMTSSDMDFARTLDIAMKNIAMAFKVPLPLLFSDASTLDNYKVAIEEFILQTVIPITEHIVNTFTEWYNFITGDNIEICIDREKIDGLEGKREIKSKRMIEFVKSGIISPNEAREMLGFDKYNDITADSLFLPSSVRPIEIMDGESLNLAPTQATNNDNKE